MKKNRKTSDAVTILCRRYVQGDAAKLAALSAIHADHEVARKIYALRTKAGLSQQELARLGGTSASAICRLEDADYAGYSLTVLNRIAAALDRSVEIRFAPVRKLVAAWPTLAVIVTASVGSLLRNES
jgi:DNA-binding XRE family transcriptional regulator